MRNRNENNEEQGRPSEIATNKVLPQDPKLFVKKNKIKRKGKTGKIRNKENKKKENRRKKKNLKNMYNLPFQIIM